MSETPERADDLAAAWRAHRPFLVDMAYRTLGDIGEAEDVVQEAYARLARTPGVADARAWLVVVTGRLCLDVIRSARRRREELGRDADMREADRPAPWPDPADRVTLDDEVRMALLVVLERLTPAERVALVLHDVFGVPYDAVGEALGRPAATCRQLAHRARARIAADPAPTPGPGAADMLAVTRRFIAACAGGDVDALVAVLHPQAWGTADLGPDSPLRPPVSHGAETVARTLLTHLGRGTLVPHPLHSGPAVLVFLDRALFGVIVLSVADGLVTSVQVIADPGA